MNIYYLNQDHLELDLPEDHFDLATLIYCDLGPLLPSERDQLLANIKKALKPGGMLIFDDDSTDVYKFWTHFFSHEDLEKILHPLGFSVTSFHEDVLPEGDMWNGSNVTFCIVNNYTA